MRPPPGGDYSGVRPADTAATRETAPKTGGRPRRQQCAHLHYLPLRNQYDVGRSAPIDLD